MRIVIETDEEEQVKVQSQEKIESEQQEKRQLQEYTDGGGPDEELLAALGEVSSTTEMQVDEQEGMAEEEVDDSTFH